MATSTTQDDLIIIDEPTSDTELINESELVNDIELVSESESGNDIIEFGNSLSDGDNVIEDDKKDTVLDDENNFGVKNNEIFIEGEENKDKLDDNNSEEVNNDNIIGDFDLSAFGSDNNEKKDDIKTEDGKALDVVANNSDVLAMGNSTVDFGLYGSNDNDDSSISDEGFDLDSETQKFIEKLNLRKEKISDLVKKDEDEISLLEEQIKKLRDNVSDIKSKIKLLNDEDKKIDSRISLINGASKPTKA